MAGIPPLKGSAYTFYVSLVAQADTDIFKTTVTLAAGDVQVSKDGGAFANVTTLPSEIGTTGVLSVPLSATEMNADVVTVRFRDAAGSEWQDLLVSVETETLQINDLATPTNIPSADITAILEDTATTIPGLIAALNNLTAAQVNAEVVDVLRTDLIPDSYSADGAQPTIAQAILAIHQFLYERAIAGSTMTVYKPDGTTAAIVLTLDDPVSPTHYTRTT